MQSSGEKPVVLNGRGYNYRTVRDPQRELEIVESEATRQQEAGPRRTADTAPLTLRAPPD